MTAPPPPPPPPKSPPQSPARNLVQATSSSPENVPEPGTPRNMYQAGRKKRFSIKGLLSGESRKERAARKEEEAKAKGGSGSVAASSNRSVDQPEAETVYQVDVDDRTISVMSNESKTTTDKTAEGFLASANKSSSSYMLKVVLLLMDPDTRRFELLQLEFDSDKALVSDVLTQIPVAVTEEVLKKQTYVGICGSEGAQMDSAILLSEFCKGNDVLVAVPDGVAASECARLAKPILNDEKVINMLKSSGIDASAWGEIKTPPPPPPPKEEPTIKTRDLPGEEDVAKEVPTTKAESGGGVFLIVFMVIVAIILQVYHSKITAPIGPGQVLSPGGWVSRCGLASLLPFCENSYLQMNDQGVLSLYNEDGGLEWKMEGAVCKTDNGCINGLEMRATDNKLAIGGKVVPWVNVKKGADPISPWPFAEQPVLKVIHAKK